MGYYGVAQICLNGHEITENYRSSPQFRKNYCKNCGSKTIYQCPNCNEEIQGDYHADGVVAIGLLRMIAPNFCHSCGEPYPWTLGKLEAARQLALITDEFGDQKEELVNSISDIVSDTPRTKLAAIQWKGALS